MDAGREIQLDIYRKMSGARRLEVAVRLTAFAYTMRDERLRRTFPLATERELQWARVRQALRLPAGLAPP